MQIKIKASNIDLTPAISDYAEKRIRMLEKFMGENVGSALAEIEVGKITHHHRQGDIFRAEVNIRTGEGKFRAVSEGEDLYSSIDDVKDEIEREIISYKDKKRTLFKKGASVVKDILKGFGKFKWKNMPKMPKLPKRRQ